jgi:hypothetical protein
VLTDIGRAPTFYDVGVDLEAAPLRALNGATGTTRG